jgi:peptidyl-prolyl cis-trans isomerase A (cyclophilin A)
VSSSLLSRVLTHAAVLVAAALALPAQAVMVRMHTALGPIDIELVENVAVGTVNNFLDYVRGGHYANTLFHRSDASNGVVQAGGFSWVPGLGGVNVIPTFAPIVLEYSASRPNKRGSIGMARSAAPNSATSQWYINTRDNSVNFGPNGSNPGYAVFGQVTAPGMAVVDALAALPVVNATACFGTPIFATLPLRTAAPSCDLINGNTLALVLAAQELPAKATQSASDRIFNYLEAAYPQYAAPAGALTGQALGYSYRYYAASGAYAGTKDGTVYYLIPALGPEILPLGTVAQWLAIAENAGY